MDNGRLKVFDEGKSSSGSGRGGRATDCDNLNSDRPHAMPFDFPKIKIKGVSYLAMSSTGLRQFFPPESTPRP